MSGRRKPSAAQKRADRVTDGAPATLVGDALAAGHLKEGAAGLVAVFPGIVDSLAPPLNLGFLDFLDPETARAIAEGWVLLAASRGTLLSIHSSLRHLNYGFARFAKSSCVGPTGPLRPPALEQIDSAFLRRFAAWSEIGRTSARGYRLAFFGTLRILQESEAWSSRLPSDLTYPEPSRRSISTGSSKESAALDPPMYDKLWTVAAEECERIRTRYAEFWAYEIDSVGREFDLVDACSSVFNMAIYLDRTFPAKMPTYNKFTRLGGNYRAHVDFDYARYREAVDLILPPVEVLVAPIVVLTQFFALNPSVVQGMLYDEDYRFDDILGRERLLIFPNKPRADDTLQRNSVTVTPNAENPGQVIRLVENLTSKPRSRDPLREHLLFLWHSYSESGTRSFGAVDEPFRDALKAFQRKHGLSAVDMETGEEVPIQLRHLRPSTTDRLHEITGGDLLKVKSITRHGSVVTIVKDYNSSRMRRHGHERLGDATQEWIRQIRSGQKVFATDRPATIDRASATPGYRCRDPMSSPMRGQVAGRLCGAYGRCPICPLAEVERTPEAYLYLSDLLVRIDDALQKVGGIAWQGRWAPVRKVLATRHLRSFDDATKAAAAGVVVPRLPPVE